MVSMYKAITVCILLPVEGYLDFLLRIHCEEGL